MPVFEVVTTADADAHVFAIHRWLRDHGPDPGTFVEELARARDRLSRLPHLGPRWVVPGVISDVRRFLLRRTQVHLYYTVDERQRIVVVRAVWHVARGRPPPL